MSVWALVPSSIDLKLEKKSALNTRIYESMVAGNGWNTPSIYTTVYDHLGKSKAGVAGLFGYKFPGHSSQKKKRFGRSLQSLFFFSTECHQWLVYVRSSDEVYNILPSITGIKSCRPLCHKTSWNKMERFFLLLFMVLDQIMYAKWWLPTQECFERLRTLPWALTTMWVPPVSPAKATSRNTFRLKWCRLSDQEI